MVFTIEEIARLLNGTVEGDKQIKVDRIAKIEEGIPGAISFLSNPKYENYLYTTEASAVIINQSFEPRKPVKATLIKVADAYSAFTLLLEQYQRISGLLIQGVEEPSYMGEGSNNGEGIYRGAFSYIGKQVKIGRHVKIYPHVYIGDQVSIGDHCVLYPGVKIYKNTVIGNYCTLHAGVVIGSDGFGFAPQSDGSYKKIPQLGNVILEDHVDIGANTVVDCATMGSTIIREGVKLDNLIQIAHNVEIGKNTVMAGQSGVSGSSKIGENCIIAGQVGIAGHLHIPNKTTILAQSGLTKSLEEEGLQLFGSPAFERKPYIRSYTVFRRLPELLERIEELEDKILNLKPTESNP
jgi:UDP-3-O-[3-hydroxymyristoyl] glucosamine N-acyltransferase